MYIVKLPNAAAHKLAVTGTASLLFSLIDTAASSLANLQGRLNAVILKVEDGDIRVLFDGNSPTSSEGILITKGSTAYFSGVPLSKMKLIRTGSTNVAVGVEVGYSDLSDSPRVGGGTGVELLSAIAGENLALDVLGVALKPIVSSSYSFLAFTDFGVNITASVATVPTMLKSISVTNVNAAVRYLQVFNSASAPVSGTTVPLFSWVIPAGSATVPAFFSKEFDGAGKYLSAGLQWAISTTKAVYTSGATASEHQINGEYI